MPGNEESVVAQGSEKMRSPLFKKSIRKAALIQLYVKSKLIYLATRNFSFDYFVIGTYVAEK